MLDADKLLERDDPSDSFALGLYGHTVAVVRDNLQWRTPRGRVAEFKRVVRPRAT